MKSVRIRSFSSPYFPAFGLNTERYRVSPKNSEYGHFSRSDSITNYKLIHFFPILPFHQPNENILWFSDVFRTKGFKREL